MPVLHDILDEILDASFKGFPPERGRVRVGEVAGLDLRLFRGDLPLPVAVLSESALRHNAAWLSRFVAATGCSLAPHGKTTLAPQLFAEQLREGAWGLTVATVHQARLAIEAGAQRVLMANQVATVGDAARLGALAADHPAVRLLTLCDSLAQLAILAEGLARSGSPRIDVLVEVGIAGGRTGCRDHEEALGVARAVAACPQVRLAGVEAFEGLHVTGQSEQDARQIDDWMGRLVRLAEDAERAGCFEPGLPEVICSAGGSAAYDLVVHALSQAARSLSRPVRVVLRSGCYLSHDDGMYRAHAAAIAARALDPSLAGEPPRAALEVWAAVQSRPDPDRVVLTLGRRDVGTDAGLPVPKRVFRPGQDTRPHPAPAHWRMVGHNDQHGMMQVQPEDTVSVGDWIAFGVSHPCTTFDKWRLIWALDDEGRVTRAIRTYF